MSLRKIALLCGIAAIAVRPAVAQSVDVGNIRDNFKKENLMKLNGGLDASAVFTAGDGTGERQPFTWFLNGNLNARLFNLIDVPFSVFLTNTGQGFNYPTPPSRLSLHPTYKWATAHLGQVAMAWSPYTLNGHQFNGVGVDVAPQGHWQASAMYGRLLKAQEYDPANTIVPAAYQRIGYGGKLTYKAANYRIGYTLFAAKDRAGSIGFVPDSFGISPTSNLVMSVDGSVTPVKNLILTGEYASSAITTNVRDTAPLPRGETQLLRPFIRENSSTSYYKAIRGNLAYSLGKAVLGLGYERIDPGYRTLGAYFFNEDLENFTLNASGTLLRDKLSLTGNAGFQHSDLEGDKSSKNKRFIGAINAAYTPNGSLNISASYSNFQTYVYIKSQFDYINRVQPYANFDTLNFTQISQNAAVNASYVLSKTDTRVHGLAVNLNFLDAVDKQGGEIRTDGRSRFYNGALAYSLLLVPENLSLSAGFNLSYSNIGALNNTILGPMAAVNVRLFNKKLTTGLSSSYNVNTSTGPAAASLQVFNTRLSASYVFVKQHNLGISLINQSRSGAQHSNNLIGTVGYGFRF